MVDNYLECYHCHHAHRAFCDLFEMAAYETVLGRLVVDAARAEDKRREQRLPTWRAARRCSMGCSASSSPPPSSRCSRARPNLYVMSILPRGIDRATFAGHRYALPGAKANAEQMRYFNETLFVEDQDLCESVQRGMRSRSYNQGRFIHSADDSGVSEHCGAPVPPPGARRARSARVAPAPERAG